MPLVFYWSLPIKTSSCPSSGSSSRFREVGCDLLLVQSTLTLPRSPYCSPSRQKTTDHDKDHDPSRYWWSSIEHF
ncbi:hypothetical protein MTR_0030s0080 [Medicago truncatula]|uniref:Uncharacterized protein n=1 Tax=Medicago truncatula TaxID=3880 RepID=G7ZUG4_MEDTR|nr:hypothetical protein MTR_0030s0080 [Medicago truncatula]